MGSSGTDQHTDTEIPAQQLCYAPVELTNDSALSILRGMLYNATGVHYELRCDGSNLLIYNQRQIEVKKLLQPKLIALVFPFAALIPVKKIFFDGYGFISVKAGLRNVRDSVAI